MLQKSAKLWLEIWNRSGRGIPVASLPLADLCKAAGLEVGNDFDEALGELEKVGAVLRLNPKELAELQGGRSVPGNLLAFTAKHRATFVRVDSPEVMQTRLLAQLSQVPSQSATTGKERADADKYVSEAAARNIIAKLEIPPHLMADARTLVDAPPVGSEEESRAESLAAARARFAALLSEKTQTSNKPELPPILRPVVVLYDLLWKVGGRCWEEAIFMPGGLHALEGLWKKWKEQANTAASFDTEPGSVIYEQKKEAATQMGRVATVLARVLNGQPAEARLAERRARLTASLEYVSKVIDLWGSMGAYPHPGRGPISEGGLWDMNGAPAQRLREPIPEAVRHEVWRRDQGRCVKCGSQENLEFDHIIPHSKGGADTARNVQLLCERCNRIKSDLI